MQTDAESLTKGSVGAPQVTTISENGDARDSRQDEMKFPGHADTSDNRTGHERGRCIRHVHGVQTSKLELREVLRPGVLKDWYKSHVQNPA